MEYSPENFRRWVESNVSRHLNQVLLALRLFNKDPKSPQGREAMNKFAHRFEMMSAPLKKEGYEKASRGSRYVHSSHKEWKKRQVPSLDKRMTKQKIALQRVTLKGTIRALAAMKQELREGKAKSLVIKAAKEMGVPAKAGAVAFWSRRWKNFIHKALTKIESPSEALTIIEGIIDEIKKRMGSGRQRRGGGWSDAKMKSHDDLLYTLEGAAKDAKDGFTGSLKIKLGVAYKRANNLKG